MAGRVDIRSVLDIHTPHVRMGHNAPVKGLFQQQKYHKLDHFTDYTNAKFWTAAVANGGNVPAVIAAANGCINIITNAITSDVTELYGTTAVLTARQGFTIEARFKLALITSVCVNFGVVDQASITNDKCAFLLGASDAVTIGTNIVEAACFVYDTTSTSDKWFCVSTLNAAAAQSVKVVSNTAPVNTVFETFRIDVNTSGDATFYRNGLIEGNIVAAITNTVAVRPYISVLTRGAAARSITPDYVEIWQNVLETSTVLW